VQYTDGNFYGTTSSGGMHGAGSVFKLTSTGTLTTLYSFCLQTGCPDGDTPVAGLPCRDLVAWMARVPQGLGVESESPWRG
jgi:uncharacterized repeat protein (TIGR03803 family)